MHIYVRRGGPNYQTGLAKMRRLGEEIGIPLEVRKKIFFYVGLHKFWCYSYVLIGVDSVGSLASLFIKLHAYKTITIPPQTMHKRTWKQFYRLEFEYHANTSELHIQILDKMIAKKYCTFITR